MTTIWIAGMFEHTKETLGMEYGSGPLGLEYLSAGVSKLSKTSHTAHRNYERSLSKPERLALIKYFTDLHFKALNKTLRDGYENPKMAAMIAVLDKVTKQTISRDMILYRGLHTLDLHLMAKKGKIITDKGFVSTSRDPEKADAFSSDSLDKNTKFRNSPFCVITLRKGSPGFIVDNGAGVDKDEFRLAEKEVLLPRGTRFKVLGHSYSLRDNKKTSRNRCNVLHLEVV